MFILVHDLTHNLIGYNLQKCACAQKDYKKWFNDMHKKLGQLEMECTSRKKLGYNKTFF